MRYIQIILLVMTFYCSELFGQDNTIKRKDAVARKQCISANFVVNVTKHQLILINEMLLNAKDDVSAYGDKKYIYKLECSDDRGLIGMFPGVVGTNIDKLETMYFSIDLPIGERRITSIWLLDPTEKDVIATLKFPDRIQPPPIKIRLSEYLNMEILSKYSVAQGVIYLSFDNGATWTPNVLSDPEHSRAAVKKLKMGQNRALAHVFYIHNLHLYRKKFVFDGQFKEMNFPENFDSNLIKEDILKIEPGMTGLPSRFDPDHKN